MNSFKASDRHRIKVVENLMIECARMVHDIGAKRAWTMRARLFSNIFSNVRISKLFRSPINNPDVKLTHTAPLKLLHGKIASLGLRNVC